MIDDYIRLKAEIVNGKISYIPTMHPNTLKSELDKYFDGEES